MAKVHLTGVQKREVEQALGHELKPVGVEGDIFEVPDHVVEHIGDFPVSPPKAEDSRAVKEAVRNLPLKSDEDAEFPAASANGTGK